MSLRGAAGRLSAALALPVWALMAAGPVAMEPQAADPARVLVMPFENVRQDGRIVWLSEASALLVADELNRLGLRVIPRDERQAAFDRLRVPPTAALTDATVLRLAQLVGAASVILGTVRMEGDVLVADAREIAIDAARLRLRASERGPLGDLFATFDRLARQLAPPAARARADVAPHPPIAAFESYIKGVLAENPKTSATYLQAALEADGGYDRARLALWDALTKQGDHRAALGVVEAIPSGSAEAPRGLFLRGLSLLELGRLDDAYLNYLSLAERQPSSAVFNNLGVIQLRRKAGAAGDAPTDYFRKAADRDPDDPDLQFNLGYAYWSVRDSTSAVHWLRESLRRAPADGEAHYVLGAALTVAGNGTEAAREKDLARRLASTFAEWDRRPPSDPVPQGLERIKDDLPLPAVRRADDAQAGGRDQQALAAFYVDRGRRLYEQERDGDAADDLNRALFLSPYHAEANLLLGRVHQRSGRLAEAIGSYKIALWSGETAAAHVALASAYLEMKDLDSARAEVALALRMEPASADARALSDRIDRADR